MSLVQKITRGQLSKFLSRYATNEKVLDIGSGGSSYDTFFPNRIAIDIDPKRNPDIVGDAHRLPFRDGEFQYILCTEVLEHLHSPQIAISEMKRVLRSRGTLIISTRFLFPIHDAPRDYFRYTKYGLEELFKDWEIIELKEEVNSQDSFAVLLQRLGYQTNLRGGKLTKLLIFLLAKFIYWIPNLVKEEFGDIRKKNKNSNIFTSGYYIACRKK